MLALPDFFFVISPTLAARGMDVGRVRGSRESRDACLPPSNKVDLAVAVNARARAPGSACAAAMSPGARSQHAGSRLVPCVFALWEHHPAAQRQAPVCTMLHPLFVSGTILPHSGRHRRRHDKGARAGSELSAEERIRLSCRKDQ